jgi:hypothetical protein
MITLKYGVLEILQHRRYLTLSLDPHDAQGLKSLQHRTTDTRYLTLSLDLSKHLEFHVHPRTGNLLQKF